MIYTVIGKKGSGKSYWVRKRTRLNKVLVYDFAGEYPGVVADDYKGLIYSVVAGQRTCYRGSEDSFVDVLRFCLGKGVLAGYDLILEECWLFGERLDWLYRYCRHYKLNDLYCVTQRPYRLSETLKSMTDVFILFRITGEYDLRFLRFLNVNVDEITSLKRGQYREVKL